ncbi:MAG: diguanylate cyclase [Pseudomonadota bacterium]
MTIKHDQSVRHFTTDVAMQLVDAFYRQPSLEQLLRVLFRQLGSLVQVTGLEYGHDSRAEAATVAASFGITRKHQVRYNLRWPEQDLGFVTLYFDQPAETHALETAEDLITLAAGALHLQLRNDRPTLPKQTNERASAEAKLTTNRRPARPDSLVLLEIDDFEALVEAQGPAWALAVTQSLQTLIDDTLRDADSVFQVEAGQLAVLLPATAPAGAEGVAKKICALVGTLHLTQGEVSAQLTACIGIATSRKRDSAEDVLKRARHALAAAQSEGPGGINNGSLRLVDTQRS